METVVVGISGASGVVLGYKTVKVLATIGYKVAAVMSQDAKFTAVEELGKSFATLEKFVATLDTDIQKRITTYHYKDFYSPIASGTFPTKGMVLLPCSMSTLAAVAMGLSDNLLKRAADVTMKERRRLVVVPREAPLSEIHLNNMLTITKAGGIIVPPSPAWYTHPKTIEEIEDFIVGRALDALGVDANLYTKWEGFNSALVESPL